MVPSAAVSAEPSDNQGGDDRDDDRDAHDEDDGDDDRAASPAESADLRALRRARRRAAREDIWNVPNALTMARVAMIPVVLWFVDAGTPRDGFIAAWLYGATAVTDLLDGWLARRQNLITIFGKFMDPLADKLLVMALLIYLTRMGRIAPWIVVVLLGREVAVTSLRAIASSEGVVIAAGESGKWKTALQMVGILCLVLHFPYPVMPFWPHPVDLNLTGQYLVLLSLVFSVTSGVEYVALFVEAVLARRSRGR